MFESFRSSSKLETQAETDVLKKESSILARFKEGPAGKLARGLALMSAIAMGEGCGMDDYLHNQVKRNPELTDLQKRMPHRHLFEFLDRADSDKEMEVDPDTAEDYIKLTIMKDQLSLIAPQNQEDQNPFLTQEALTETLTELEAVYSAEDNENGVMAWRAFQAKHENVLKLVRQTFEEHPTMLQSAAQALDEETYGYLDTDKNGTLSEDEQLQALRLRVFGTGVGSAAAFSRSIDRRVKEQTLAGIKN